MTVTETCEIDCMTCIANLASGIPHENDHTMRWNGVIHGTHYSMGSGVTRPLCVFEKCTDGAWRVTRGPSKGWRIE